MRNANHARRFGAALLPFLAACSGAGGGGGSPTEPALGPSASCAASVTVALQPGQTMSLSAEQAACFRIQPSAGARYALAAFDARGVEAARVGAEPYMAGEQATYALGDGAQAPSLGAKFSRASGGRHADPDAPAVLSETPGDASDPFVRTRPWAAGETFPLRRRLGGNDVMSARVFRVVAGRYVFAVVDGDGSSHTSKFVEQTNDAIDFLERDGLAVLDAAYGARGPVTSAGSGQLLVVLAKWDPAQGAGNATTFVPADGSGVYSMVWLNLDVRPGKGEGFGMFDFSSYRLKTLSHEMTHAWQMRYLFETRGSGRAELPYPAIWALEGSADLVAMDVVRRSLGIGAAANWDWDARLTSENRFVTYALEPADTRGRVSRGYFDASSFLRHLQAQLARRGMAEPAALGEVARGAVEGWFGIDGLGVRRTGLAARMAAGLGRGWDPADAVLGWTLAQALDEQTSNPDLNNPFYRGAGDADARYAWKAAADEVKVGGSFTREFAHTAGSAFFVRLRDDGAGGEVAARSSVAGTRWMVARAK